MGSRFRGWANLNPNNGHHRMSVVEAANEDMGRGQRSCTDLSEGDASPKVLHKGPYPTLSIFVRKSTFDGPPLP